MLKAILALHQFNILLVNSLLDTKNIYFNWLGRNVILLYEFCYSSLRFSQLALFFAKIAVKNCQICLGVKFCFLRFYKMHNYLIGMFE